MENKINGRDAFICDANAKKIAEQLKSVPVPDLDALRIIPRHEPPLRYWVVVGSHIKGFKTQAEAEADAILSARSYPGQTIRVTKTIKAYRTKEPAVETLESE